jgi:CRISPR/Cas system CMR-associated protein Cmr5 small subunit
MLEVFKNDYTIYKGYSDSFWTLPSHFSLFTGMSPKKHGIHEDLSKNNFESTMELGSHYTGTTLAWELGKKGYETIAVSNNPIVSPLSGLSKGFKTFILHTNWIPNIIGLNYFEQKKLKYYLKKYDIKYDINNEDKLKLFTTFFKISKKNLKESLKMTSLYAKIKFKKLSNPIVMDKGHLFTLSLLDGFEFREPFFLFVNLMEAHEPYYNTDPNPLLLLKYKSKKGTIMKRLKAYYRSTNLCINTVSEIAKILNNKSIISRTLFIFTSDHGQEFREHGSLGHMSGHLYEENIGIPMVIKPPINIKIKPSDCYVGLSNIYNLIMDIVSGTKEWSPSCYGGVSESYNGIYPDPTSNLGINRVAVFNKNNKVVYRVNDDVVEEVIKEGKNIDPSSPEARILAKELISSVIK